MTADTLRIILLILGVLLVAGIYLFDRYQDRRNRPGQGSFRRQRKAPVISEPPTGAEVQPPPAPELEPIVADAEQSAAATKSEADGTGDQPAVATGAAADDSEGPPPAMAAAAPRHSEPQHSEPQHSEVEPQPAAPAPPSGENWQLPLDDEPQLSPELNFSAQEGTDYLHQVEGVDDGLPKMILQINVVPRQGVFDGERLEAACRNAGLLPGDLDIFHCYDQRRADMVVFSVASLVEPGSFPLQDMADYSTPGVTLFTQLPGVMDGMAVYTRMVSVAERMAQLLDAELQDDSGSTLSRQCIERTKESIVEFQRELALARRRA